MENGFKNREVLRFRYREELQLTLNEVISIEEYGFIPIPLGEEYPPKVYEITLTKPKRKWMIPKIERILRAEYYNTEHFQGGPKNIFISMELGLIEVIAFSDGTVLAKCNDMDGLTKFGEIQGNWVRFRVTKEEE